MSCGIGSPKQLFRVQQQRKGPLRPHGPHALGGGRAPFRSITLAHTQQTGGGQTGASRPYGGGRDEAGGRGNRSAGPGRRERTRRLLGDAPAGLAPARRAPRAARPGGGTSPVPTAASCRRASASSRATKVDAEHQIIATHRLVTTSADYRALVPFVHEISRHLGRGSPVMRALPARRTLRP